MAQFAGGCSIQRTLKSHNDYLVELKEKYSNIQKTTLVANITFLIDGKLIIETTGYLADDC